MTQTPKIRARLAEFGIIVLGVAVALAADGWRQSLQDRDLERQYLTRLKGELLEGRDRVARREAQTSNSGIAVEQLISALEEGPVVDTVAFLALAVQAGQTGFQRNSISHDATYDELIATGNLALIRDGDLRSALVHHYRLEGVIIGRLEQLPDEYWRRFQSLTGHSSSQYTNGALELTVADEQRLFLDLSSNEETIGELRWLHSQLEGLRSPFVELLESLDGLLLLL